MIKWLIPLFLISFQGLATTTLIPNNVKVVISSLTHCHTNQQYSIEVYNVVVNIINRKLTVTGTLSTSVDLVSPIKAILKVEKDELGAWIKIPCINGIGSCTYDDLCIHSIPSNNTCPNSFINNNVPCRCPISKGTYTLPASLEFDIDPNSYSAVYTGKYWARASLTHENKELTCYEVYFSLKAASFYEENLTDVDNNYLDNRISVALI